MSETEKTLEQKLAEVGLIVGYVQKDKTNSGMGYSYASAEAVLRKVNQELFSRQVVMEVQANVVRLSEDFKQAVVQYVISFTDGAGRKLYVSGLGQGSDRGDKAIMKANTAAMKYALAAAFCISWGDDPEADATTDREAAAEAPKPKKGRAKKFTLDGNLLEAIDGAKDVETLDAIRPHIIAIREENPELYAIAVENFKARKTAVAAEAN